MTKIATLTILALVSASPLWAQQMSEMPICEKPNYDLIRQQTGSSRCADFYPNLLARYQQCDTTLTLEDYRNLYYGFALQEDYIPYEKENSLALEARTELIEHHASVDVCPEVLAKAQSALLDNPFDMPALTIIPICYRQLNDTLNYELWTIKLHGVMEAITSSGTGETPATAFHVINIEHEYEVLNRLGLELSQIEVVDKNTDFIRVKENSDSIPGVYFNYGAISRSYKQKYR